MKNPRSQIRSSKSLRGGLTLVELLVVIVIMLILTTVAIPVLAPNGEQRRIREAARLVSTFISGARSRALELGRPVGIQFERLASNPNASMVLSYVEVPPPYAGESIGSVCSLEVTGGTPITVEATMPAADFNNKLIRVNDYIKFNYQGRLFRITGPSDGTPAQTIADPASGDPHKLICVATPFIAGQTPNQVFSWSYYDTTTDPSNPTWAGTSPTPVPYQIFRQPVKSSGTPLQLPEGAVVDLSLSGSGINGYEFNADPGVSSPATGALMLLFGTNGSLSEIYGSGNAVSLPYISPSRPVHLHIGRSDGVGNVDASFPDPKVLWNLRDATNLWVSIGVQTGMVSTTESGAVTVGAITTFDSDYTDALQQSRAIAHTQQSMGGR